MNFKYVAEGLSVVELKAPRTLGAFKPLRHYLKARQPDAILSVLTHVNVITALTCLSLGMTGILSTSERNTFSLDRKLNNDPTVKLAYWLAPYIYRWLPKPVIAVSNGVADDLVACSCVRRKDVTSASNPVITVETRNAAMALPSHPWLLNKEGKKVIVSVGRLSHQKGYDMLLPALKQAADNSDVRLVIFGEGELRDDLANQAKLLNIADRVDMPGYTENPIAEVQAADLFVLSSRFEGSPNGLVEAMSVGTPVVAFDCPHGPREILDGGKVAPLVEYKNINALASAIESELNSSVDKATKRQQIIQSVSRFSSENSAAEYLKLILPGKQ
nr:glycosyltransferase [Alteromonas confluentis]